MDKILSIGALRSSVRQKLAPVALRKVEQFLKNILDFWIFSKNFKKSKNPRFSSKITQLCGELQERGFVAQSF